MITHASIIPANTTLETEVCIVGGGPAGIALALEFSGQPFRVILLEGGEVKYDRVSQALYRGTNIGLHYEDLHQSRSRFFGGSSNCWAGFCRQFDEHDFEARDWVPNSGWPITLADLQPHYYRAHQLLQLGPVNFDPRLWEDLIGRRDARLIQFDRERAINIIAQVSPPTRLGQLYRGDIARSGNVSTYLGANVTEIETPGTGSAVTGLRVRTLTGGGFRVVAQTYVLAIGGIETPRLMLASNRYQPAGVGNQHDVVGRYFMDHPRLRSGEIVFRNPESNSRIYDMHSTLARKMTARGVKVSGFFGLTPETQRAERLGNTRCCVKSRFIGDSRETHLAALTLFRTIGERRPLRDRSRTEVIRMLTHLPQVTVMAAGLKLNLPILTRGFTLETVVEPTPLPDSRVTLGSERDALGMPRVKVDWRLGELEKRTIRRTQEILGEELARAGAGEVLVDAPQEGEAWPDSIVGCWHHMGTARMHADPRKGVVDSDCRVHGMSNLFIAGSSVFPTCGSDTPTVNIVALALRLAQHIKRQYGIDAAADMDWRTASSESLERTETFRATTDSEAGSSRTVAALTGRDG
jgi:choline dehydrogenase-like flavoprotein